MKRFLKGKEQSQNQFNHTLITFPMVYDQRRKKSHQLQRKVENDIVLKITFFKELYIHTGNTHTLKGNHQ